MEYTDLTQFVPKVHFEQIPIKNLVSNQDYQRNLSALHIRRMAEKFDLYQINPVKVSRRDKVNNVINGQHTIETVALVSGSRDTAVWCMIYDDLDYRREADIFARQQDYTRSLMPYELFMARIQAGDDNVLLVKSLVESYGLFLSKTKKPGRICAVATLLTIYNTYGYSTLDRTLRLAIGTWEGEAISLSAGMLKGIALLVDSFGENMKDELFKDKVGAFSARDISRTAKERRHGSLGFAEAMLTEYNKKLKASLKWSNLYKKKSDMHKNPYAEMQDEESAANKNNKI